LNLDPTKTVSYDYELPKELIAMTPANPKDSAKLLIYDRKTQTITHEIFKNIFNYIPKKTSFILNDTKVIKARLFGRKKSGGKIELLLHKPLADGTYEVMIRGRVKEGLTLLFENNLSAKVEKIKKTGIKVVRFFLHNKECDFETLVHTLEAIGHVPLPPYIQRKDCAKDAIDYQTKFSKHYGAVAAPTASLHFTEALFQKMQDEFDVYYITLHVGAGTFKPVDSQIITDHQMHSEIFNIPNNTAKLLQSDAKIIAIGTTVARTVEDFARFKRVSGECSLFLHPNNPPQRVDYLLTNFHLPKSTLIMLVASFIGLPECLRVYQEAIKKRYRFFSYGDAMLIL